MSGSSKAEPWVESPLRGNFYQSASYYCSTFALITTLSEEGLTNIGPYQLSFPFEVIHDYSVLLTSRPDSNTVNNIRRTGRCVLNYIEYDRDLLESIVALGYPGQSTEEKLSDAGVFTLEPCPVKGEDMPLVLKEAFQLYVCSWDETRTLDALIRRSPSAHLLLDLEQIYLRENWCDNLDGGCEKMPRLPLTYGFRGSSKFWFGEPNPGFWLPLPDRGNSVETVLYEANRIDPDYQFTRAACQALSSVPPAFLEVAMYGTVEVAKERGVHSIDETFVRELQRELGYG